MPVRTSIEQLSGNRGNGQKIDQMDVRGFGTEPRRAGHVRHSQVAHHVVLREGGAVHRCRYDSAPTAVATTAAAGGTSCCGCDTTTITISGGGRHHVPIRLGTRHFHGEEQPCKVGLWM